MGIKAAPLNSSSYKNVETVYAKHEGVYKEVVKIYAKHRHAYSVVYDKPQVRYIYGFHIDPTNTDCANAVTYLEDAIGKTPAAMGSDEFSYGDWADAFFLPKPCMLKYDGTVDYYLDPDDYTKKLDGTASDVANLSYEGNAMMEWPKIWFKIVTTNTVGEASVYISNYKADDDYHCWSNLDCNGHEINHFYTAIYNGTGTSKLRSMSGLALTTSNGNGSNTYATEVSRAEANNTITQNKEWYIGTYGDYVLMLMLLVLMGKSLNGQGVYGIGLAPSSNGQGVKESYMTGALNDKGLFWGSKSSYTYGIKIFGMENFWGATWQRLAGCVSVGTTAYLKLTYSTADGTTATGYNADGTGYLNAGSLPSSTNGPVAKMAYNQLGYFMPAVYGDTNSWWQRYYADWFYHDTSGLNYGAKYLAVGGSAYDSENGPAFVGPFYFNISMFASSANWNCASRLSCKPIAASS